jgi:hypothetical protein
MAKIQSYAWTTKENSFYLQMNFHEYVQYVYDIKLEPM